VLRDVSFAAAPGVVTALVGRSGSGKSSLLHIVAGLLRPTAGQVVIDGKVVSGPTPRAVMMFQSPSLYPWLTVAQNVALGLRFARVKRAEIARRVGAALALVGLEAEADRRATAISGGQAQRAALARAIVMEPDVLLLDEPLAALDLFTRLDLQRDLRAIAARLGVTVLLVSHDLPEIVRMADHAVFLAGQPARIVAETPVVGSGPETALRAETARLTAIYETAGVTAEPARAYAL
jgi:NitT/TauT family transport system ATP-binding protein